MSDHLTAAIEQLIRDLTTAPHPSSPQECQEIRELLQKNWGMILHNRLDTAYQQNVFRLAHLLYPFRPNTDILESYFSSLAAGLTSFVTQTLFSGFWLPASKRHAIKLANETLYRLLKNDMCCVIRAYEDYKYTQHVQGVDNTIDNFDHNMMLLFKELVGSPYPHTSSGHGGASQHKGLSSSAETAAQNVNAVAAAAQELTASIQAINSQVTVSSDIVGNVVKKSATTTQTLNRLQENADRINDITVFITHIAEQTSLLSLNATIEAARAGEAGRGFSVVASEVKALAKQTAQATSEIADQVKNVQAAIQDTAVAIQDISATIDKMNDVTSSVTTAVGDQTVAMNEITKSIQFAADSASQVTGLAQKMTEKLRAQLDIFLSEIKARI